MSEAISSLPKSNWEAAFATAHLHSWPTASLSISNAEPTADQKAHGKRNLYREDKAAIEAAARRHGYHAIFRSCAVVSFLNPSRHGEAGCVVELTVPAN